MWLFLLFYLRGCAKLGVIEKEAGTHGMPALSISPNPQNPQHPMNISAYP